MTPRIHLAHRLPTQRLRDCAPALASRGYLFTAGLHEDERRRLASEDGVEIPFLGRTALLVSGEEGVRLFYDTHRMARRGAVPGFVSRVLFGPGAVHGLDDGEHAHRKAMFLGLLDERGCRRLRELVQEGWQQRSKQWVAGAESDNVYDASVEVFGRAVVDWAGVPENAPELVAHRLAEIVDGFGSAGRANLRARRARRSIDRWAGAWIRRARTEDSAALPAETPLQQVAHARDPDGELLSEETAAVELVNLLRPTVAVAWLATFAAVALAEHPEWRDRLRGTFSTGDEGDAVAFAHEVRRFYPFVPVLAARARADFDWQGFAVSKGQRVLLDVYGTDHGQGWTDPWAFDPARFLDLDPMTTSWFVPQGGGRPETGHRCPGEGVATALLVETLRTLVQHEPAQVDLADLSWSRRRMPTRPSTGVRVQVPSA
jgi:fatty-acid peroxygenase